MSVMQDLYDIRKTNEEILKKVYSLQDENREILKTLRNLTTMAESWQIDWDKYIASSPDYDPDYKPNFNDETQRAREVLRKYGVTF